MFFGVNPATVMSTVFVAARADGTESTASATRMSGSFLIGKRFGLRGLLPLPPPGDIRFFLPLLEHARSRHRRHGEAGLGDRVEARAGRLAGGRRGHERR